MSSPAETRAIIVGVETYAVGKTWDLPGPINDAINFADWLIARGVDRSHIILFLSDHAPSQPGIAQAKDLPIPAGVEVRKATHDLINKALVDELPGKAPALLWFYWGGHGVIDEDEPRLFCADATVQNKLNINLRSLRAFLASNHFKKPFEFITTIDACAHFVDAANFAFGLPNHTYPKGKAVVGRPQFNLLAARRGESALNDSAAKTGLFSRELIALLRAAPAGIWPPDLDALNTSLKSCFRQLSETLPVEQVPVFEFSDGEGNGYKSRTAPPPAPTASPMDPPVLQIVVAPAFEYEDTSRVPVPRYEVRAWLWKTTEPHPLDPTRWPAGPHNRTDLHTLLPRVIVQAVRLLSDDRMRIEVIVPHELLESRFDTSSCETATDDPIGHQWPVVTRSFERIYPHAEDLALNTAQKTWLRKWKELLSASATAVHAWACKDADYTSEFVGTLESAHIFVGFTLRPASGLELKNSADVLGKIIRRGMPLAVWLHDHNGPEKSSRSRLKKFLLDRPVHEWPEAVRKLRTAGMATAKKPPAFAGLTLLWDNADHLPPDADAPLLQSPA